MLVSSEENVQCLVLVDIFNNIAAGMQLQQLPLRTAAKKKVQASRIVGVFLAPSVRQKDPQVLSVLERKVPPVRNFCRLVFRRFALDRVLVVAIAGHYKNSEKVDDGQLWVVGRVCGVVDILGDARPFEPHAVATVLLGTRTGFRQLFLSVTPSRLTRTLSWQHLQTQCCESYYSKCSSTRLVTPLVGSTRPGGSDGGC